MSMMNVRVRVILAFAIALFLISLVPIFTGSAGTAAITGNPVMHVPAISAIGMLVSVAILLCMAALYKLGKIIR